MQQETIDIILGGDLDAYDAVVFRGQLHFDRPVVALILQKDLLDDSDMQLALPATDFRNIFRRGINDADVVTLSPDRRVLHVALNVKNGVDQIRVLVAADNNITKQKWGRFPPATTNASAGRNRPYGTCLND